MTAQLRAGDRLRLETLAAELGISVTPVREALLTLRGEGFVDLAPRKGFLVAHLTRQDLEDTYHVGAVAAGELAARAAQRITPGQLAELESLHVELEHACRDCRDDALDHISARFHRDINRIACASKLVWFLGIAQRYAPRRSASITGWREATVSHHRTIIVAFRDRDADAARQAVRDHLTRSCQLLINHLSEIGFWAT